jgi:predicted dehydrogenase
VAPLRVGLVGLGQIATLHVAAYEALAETRIVAICDADPERLRFWSDRLPGVAQFTDFDRFLDQELDIVEVLTPIRHTRI